MVVIFSNVIDTHMYVRLLKILLTYFCNNKKYVNIIEGRKCCCKVEAKLMNNLMVFGLQSLTMIFKVTKRKRVDVSNQLLFFCRNDYDNKAIYL